MSVVILPKRSVWWKPSLSAEINWGHPLARGMDSCLLFNEGGGLPVDIAAPYRKWTGGPSGTRPPWNAGANGPLLDATSGAHFSIQPSATISIGGSWACRMRVKFNATGITGTSIGWCCGGSGGEAGFAIRNGHGIGTYPSSGGEVSGTTQFIANTWYDEVWSYDGTNVTLYLNGRVDNPAQALLSASGTPLNVLFDTTNGYTAFNGWCDCWQHWNRALTAAEVNQLFADPFGFITAARVRYFIPAPSGGTVYTQSLAAGTASWSATLPRQTAKISNLAAGNASWSATLPRSTNRGIAATMGAWAAAVAKLSPKALTATIGAWAGTLSKSAGKILAATMATWAATLARGEAIHLSLAATMATWTGTLAKLPVKVKAIAATMANFAGTLGKFPMKAFAAVMANWSASIGKSTRKILAAATMASWAGTLGALQVKVKAIAATMANFAGTLGKFPMKAFAAVMANWSASIGKSTRKILAAATMASWTAALARGGAILLSLAATMSAFSAVLTSRWAKVLGQSIRLQIFNALETLLKGTMPPPVPSIRLQIFDALYQLLTGGGGPLNLSIFKERLRPIEKQELPAILIYADDDIPKTLAAQVYKAPLTERQLSLVVECRAQASQTMTADEALDPLLVWAEQVIIQNEQFGGLASGVEELRTVWLSHEGEIPVAAAAIHFTVKYRTARGDLTKKDPKS